MKRAIAYCRVSTDRQAREGVSLPAQVAQAERWAELHGYRLDAGDVYTDRGLSGKRADNRPQLQAALAAACEAKAPLIVYSLSRLTRTIRDAIEIAETLNDAGADLVSLSESVDTTTAAGRAFFAITAVFAQLERETTAERIRDTFAEKRRRGEKCGGFTPYGYTAREIERDGRRVKVLQTDEREQQAVQLAAQLRQDGETLRAIAEQLNAQAIPAKRGGTWHPMSVKRALQNADAVNLADQQEQALERA